MTTKSRRSLRLPDVEKKVGVKRTQILEAVERGDFPAPFRVLPGGRAIAWDEGEVDEHLANQMANARAHTKQQKETA
jgi:predicted DNA-binding transcriptional regulator AlpA